MQEDSVANSLKGEKIGFQWTKNVEDIGSLWIQREVRQREFGSRIRSIK